MKSLHKKELTPLAKLIKERRAVKGNYTSKEVTEATVHALLDNAIWAPTHGMRQPWRFIFVSADTLPTFAKNVAATYTPELQENRENYLNEPNAILVVIMEAPEAKKLRDENYGATAAMIQNFWLLAWEQELGVVWKTNPHICYPEVEQLLNVTDEEEIVGFIHLGYFDRQPLRKDRTAVAEKFDVYQG